MFYRMVGEEITLVASLLPALAVFLQPPFSSIFSLLMLWVVLAVMAAPIVA